MAENNIKVAIFGSRHQTEGYIKRIFEILENNSVAIYMQKRFFEYLQSNFDLEYNIAGIIEEDEFDADLAISIGGDGTFLRTAAIVGRQDIPIFGINTGRLGFLADVTEENLEIALAEILQGKYRLETRSRLHLKTVDKSYHGFNYALNEIAILKQDTASMITVHAQIDGEYLTSYEGDGLIIATPTGSTAYALSVGGPIMAPTTSSFILAPVAPHTLNARPLIIDNDCVITLEVESRSKNFLISLDGRSNIFSTKTCLTIEKAPHSLKVVKRLNHTFYETLRGKLMWGADPRKG